MWSTVTIPGTPKSFLLAILVGNANPDRDNEAKEEDSLISLTLRFLSHVVYCRNTLDKGCLLCIEREMLF